MIFYFILEVVERPYDLPSNTEVNTMEKSKGIHKKILWVLCGEQIYFDILFRMRRGEKLWKVRTKFLWFSSKPSLSKGALLACQTFADYKILRTISNLGRCFLRVLLQVGHLETKKIVLTINPFTFGSDCIPPSPTHYISKWWRKPKLFDYCTPNLGKLSRSVDENILSAPRLENTITDAVFFSSQTTLCNSGLAIAEVIESVVRNLQT